LTRESRAKIEQDMKQPDGVFARLLSRAPDPAAVARLLAGGS